MLLKHIFTVVTLSSLVACAGANGGAGEGSGGASAGRSDCIFKGSVRDYQVLDSRTLIFLASGNKAYLAQLARRVNDLATGYRLGLVSDTSRLCAGFGEVVVTNNFGTETVRITHIQLLTPDEHEEILIRFGKKEPDVVHTPEPEEVEGAEVEELD